jgi:hypothetical protein
VEDLDAMIVVLLRMRKEMRIMKTKIYTSYPQAALK